jgi:hypothetical protein
MLHAILLFSEKGSILAYQPSLRATNAMRGKSILLLTFILLFYAPAPGQEVDCTVQVNYDAIPTTNRDLLVNLAADIQGYVSNYNWGGSGEPGDKVKCTLNIFVQSVVGDNQYNAQVFIGSVRPRYYSDQSSAVVRLFDQAWEFTYIKDRPVNKNPYTFNDFASFLDFYMYLIMGYDFDTYDRLGGTPLFQKAADVARLGRASGLKSWQPTTASYSRTQLVDELLNPKYEPVRVASWIYHFSGLDSLSLSPERGYANIIAALEMIARAGSSVDPRNLVIRCWFDAKYLELAQVFQNYPDPSIYLRLAKIDPANQKTYDEYRLKKKGESRE